VRKFEYTTTVATLAVTTVETKGTATTPGPKPANRISKENSKQGLHNQYLITGRSSQHNSPLRSVMILANTEETEQRK
jgi:hypothetical protein